MAKVTDRGETNIHFHTILSASGLFTADPRVRLFADIKGHILVLDHMMDLSPHGQEKEEEKVHQQDRPEHRDIKGIKDGTAEGHTG